MLKYIFYKTVTNLPQNLQAILIKNQARNTGKDKWHSKNAKKFSGYVVRTDYSNYSKFQIIHIFNLLSIRFTHFDLFPFFSLLRFHFGSFFNTFQSIDEAT